MEKNNITLEDYDKAVAKWKKAHSKEYAASNVLDALNVIRLWLQEGLV